MKTIYTILIILFFYLPSANANPKPLAGWVERVKIFPSDIIIHAKLDTGADHSSLSATNLIEFEKNGSTWVKFDIHNRYGKKATLERKVERVARIKRVGGKVQKRSVIRLTLCLGTHYMDVDVNLNDRTDFDFQMLIGRSFLAGNVNIDPSSMYLLEPNCKEVK